MGGIEKEGGGRQGRRGWDRIGLGLDAILALNKLQLFFRVRDSFQPTDLAILDGIWPRNIDSDSFGMGPAAKLIRL